MRGLTLVRVFGCVMLKASVIGAKVTGSRICAFTNCASRCWRRLNSMKKDAFLESGPVRLAIRFLVSENGLLGSGEYGLRALNNESEKTAFTVPWNLSVPGLVKISMRPWPCVSNSAENGLELMRISRIDSLG